MPRIIATFRKRTSAVPFFWKRIFRLSARRGWLQTSKGDGTRGKGRYEKKRSLEVLSRGALNVTRDTIAVHNAIVSRKLRHVRSSFFATRNFGEQIFKSTDYRKYTYYKYTKMLMLTKTRRRIRRDCDIFRKDIGWALEKGCIRRVRLLERLIL